MEKFCMCCRFSRRDGNSPKSSVYKYAGPFFPGRLNFFSNPKSVSLGSVLLACKKLLPSEQVFLIENVCLIVAEIANCSNFGFETERKLLVPFLRNPNLPFKREKLNIREKCGDCLNSKGIIGTIRDFVNIYAELFH